MLNNGAPQDADDIEEPQHWRSWHSASTGRGWPPGQPRGHPRPPCRLAGTAPTKYAFLELDSLVALVSLDGVVGQQRGDGDLGLGRGGQDGGQPGDRG